MLVLARVELFLFIAARNGLCFEFGLKKADLEASVAVHEVCWSRSNPKGLQFVDKCKLEQEGREQC